MLSQTVKSYPPLLRLLDQNGDGSGDKEITGDYSGAPVIFKCVPPDNQIFVLSELLIQYTQTGGFGQGDYGSGLALPNGLIIAAYDREDNIILSLTDNGTVNINDDWFHLGYRTELFDWGGVGVETTLTANLFAEHFGTPFQLDGSKGEYIAVTANDDFTAFTDQHGLVKGYIR